MRFATQTRRGSPPRVRGKAEIPVNVHINGGITPACAGKSVKPVLLERLIEDHPRVCGEKGTRCRIAAARPGSPPRVRGKASRFPPFAWRLGITPACAGKSRPGGLRGGLGGDHPRVCGEKSPWRAARRPGWGSPPRVRGKEYWGLLYAISRRITPACAGKRLKKPRNDGLFQFVSLRFHSVSNTPDESNCNRLMRDAPDFRKCPNAAPA